MSKVITIADLNSVSSGAAVDLTREAGQGAGGTLIVQGTFVATWFVEISVDGTNWIPAKTEVGAAATGNAVGAFLLRTGAPLIRGRVSAYTSGTVSFRLIPL